VASTTVISGGNGVSRRSSRIALFDSYRSFSPSRRYRSIRGSTSLHRISSRHRCVNVMALMVARHGNNSAQNKLIMA